jgi:potassium/chloride transporter 4/5/6
VSDGICHLIQTVGLGGMKPNTIILGWPNSWRKREDESCQVFVEAIRDAASAKMALLIPKGVQRYPETGDKVKGNIDIWWIVHDGGLLMLLPFLLKQHRTWKNCKLRIFSIAQPEDNSIQMKKDLNTFLYHLRIEAEVEVVELNDSDISDYTYERTLIMEQRNEMLKEMQLSEKRKGKMVDAVMDNIRAEAQGDRAVSPPEERSPSKVTFAEGGPEQRGNSLNVPKRNDTNNVRRMHTAVRLNEVIVSKSHEAKLVILNLPSPPKTVGADRDSSYMEFLEVLTEGLERVLMVRGGGREVITIYS